MNYSMLIMAQARHEEIAREAGERKLAGEASRAARTARRPGMRRERRMTMAAAAARPAGTGR